MRQSFHQKQNNKTIKVKSLKDMIALGKIDEHNTLTVKHPVINEKPKTKVSIGL